MLFVLALFSSRFLLSGDSRWQDIPLATPVERVSILPIVTAEVPDVGHKLIPDTITGQGNGIC